jgi:predicted nucleotide-binding protein
VAISVEERALVESKNVAAAPRAPLTAQEMRRGIERLRKRVEEVQAFKPSGVRDAFTDPMVDRLRASVGDTIAGVFGDHTPACQRFIRAADFSTGFTFMNRDPRPGEVAALFETYKQRSLGLLASAIQSLEEQLEPEPLEGAAQADPQRATNKVFVVHGHDEGAKHELARFLERIELEAVILQERPNQGRTIIEKFQACADEVGFAVVLFTPDDLGAAKAASAPADRARQNVVFELGYFVAKLGRGKVCLLRKGDVEIPSDLYGVIYTELDANEGWKIALVKELKAAGLAFDANKVWG